MPRIPLPLAACVALAVASATGAQAPPPAAAAIVLPARVELVVDNSGSMRQNDPGSVVKEGLGALVAGLRPADQAGIVLFDETARAVSPLRSVGDAGARESMQAILRGVTYSGRLTNIPAAIERALYELDAKGATPGLSAIVMVTDGIIDTGSPQKNAESTRWLKEALLPDCKRRGVRIYGVAFTERADYQLLQTMAFATDGEYFRILRPEDAPATFAQLARSLATSPLLAPPRVPAPAPVSAPAAAMPPPAVAAPVDTRSPLMLIITVLGAALAIGLLALAISMALRRTSGSTDSNLPYRGDAPIPPEPDGAPGDEPPAARLVDGSGHSHPVVAAVTRVGRDPKSDIIVEDRTISSSHARIDWRGGRFWIVDLRSLNGTFLNGERVLGEKVLRHGDIVRFHTRDYRFQSDADEDRRGGTVIGNRTLLAATPPPPPTSGIQTCRRHPTEPITGRCTSCGNPRCENCLTEATGGGLACQDCA